MKNVEVMKDKSDFLNTMKDRTKRFSVEIINFCDSLNDKKASSVITTQLIKSAASTGANYRAACETKSKAEFFSKICIVSEELDTSNYWLEIIKECNLSSSANELDRLISESVELSKTVTRAKRTTFSRS